MAYRKKLAKLNDKEFAEDIKKYINSSHTFYEHRVPEIKVLAKRLHEEYRLKDFYKVFNKFWKFGYNEERSLAIYTLQLYKNEYNIETWEFIKNKLKEIRSWDKLDGISINIIGEIILRNPSVKRDILIFSESKNIWFKRAALMSMIPLIRNGDVDFSLKLINKSLYYNEERIQNANGILLKEISIKKPNIAKKFILKNIHMPIITFNIAAENMKDLRKLRDIKKYKPNGLSKLLFWKN